MKGGIWIVSYFVLWALVVVLAVAVVALLRQIGVLHARISPVGTHFAGEGPEVGSSAPAVGIEWSAASLTTLLFTSATCVVCRELKPSISSLKSQYRDVRFETVDLNLDQPTFTAFNVRSTPYVVTVNALGAVCGRGVANTVEQIEELIRESAMAESDK
jgi:thiol-disulfide isomerase/thioredoxin